MEVKEGEEGGERAEMRGREETVVANGCWLCAGFRKDA